MSKHEEIEQARSDVRRLKQEYETACQVWQAQRSANKQIEMHRVKREYEKARYVLQQLEHELARATAKQREQELARAATHQREQEREGPRALASHAWVPRSRGGLER